MDMEYWKLTRLEFSNLRLLIYLVSIAFFSVSATRFLTESRSALSNGVDFHFQAAAAARQMQGQNNSRGGGGGRKLLSGLGSSPPRCISKCGRCTPCRPVHVPVPPGTPVTAEYYPEAWRCKCGNKLFMP